MHATRLAPLLSATSRTVCIWITGLAPLRRGAFDHFGAGDDLRDAPALVLRQRPGLGNAHDVADLAGLVFVVRLVLLLLRHVLAVAAVLHAALDLHHHRLRHLVGGDGADARLGTPAGRMLLVLDVLGHGLTLLLRRQGLCLAGRLLLLVQHGEHPRQVAPLLAQVRARVERPRRLAYPQVEHVLPQLGGLAGQLVDGQVSQFGGLHRLRSQLRRAADEPGGQGQLVRGEQHRLLGDLLGHAFHLVEDAAHLDHRVPLLDVALAVAHARLGRLLGDRLVREHADPDLAAALDEASRLSLLHRGRRGRRGPRRGGPGGARAYLLGGGALGEHLAAEDPHLAADLPVGRPRLGEAVVDVRAQRVQRHAPLAVPLVAGHLRAAQAARAGHADALGAELLRRLDGLLHRAAEGDAALELGGDVLRDELRVGLRLAHLDDVQEHLVLGELLQLLLDLLDARAALADHDARPRGVHVDLHLVGGALDLDLADAGLAQLLLHVLAQLDVLVQPLGVVLLLVPLGVPGADDAQAEADRIDLLTHCALPRPSPAARSPCVSPASSCAPEARPRPRWRCGWSSSAP